MSKAPTAVDPLPFDQLDRRDGSFRHALFSWVSILLFVLIFCYGLLGLFRMAEFDLLRVLGLTFPASVCGVLGQASRIRSLTASLLGGRLSVEMGDANEGTGDSGNQRRNGSRKHLTRNGKPDG
jgi:hypothetical protein